jgi:putative toxin-antitoxin system antitoxin component (TIGR02293 family)
MGQLSHAKDTRVTGAAVARVLGVQASDADLVEVTRKGLPAGSALRLAATGGLSMTQLAAALGVSGRTLARKKGKQLLGAVESDRAVRLARVLALALDVFAGRKAAVIAWLHEPIVALGGKSPVEFVDTDAGLRRVEQILLRLDYGGIS